MRLSYLLLAAILLLAACATSPAPSGTGPSGASGQGISGTFNGSAALEGGCSWLDTGETRYQLALPQGYRVDYEQLAIVGSDGKTVAKAGDMITVTGRKIPEQLSFCQVGPIFDVKTISTGS
ncbi:MAG: hypothetical protein ACRDYA_02770 [Egibacteraceae bacterium]